MSDRTKGVERAHSSRAAPRGIGRVFRSIIAVFAAWRERAEQRRHLAAMNDRILKDIGIRRSEAIREAGKPFWLA